MKVKFSFIILSIFLVQLSFSQSFVTDSLSKAEVSKLMFLVGNWEGKGWIVGPDRKKKEFDQTEKINFKLDNTAILIEGLGKSNGRITHNAMAIISFNKKDNNYNFQSYLQNGSKGDFKGELINNKFYWYPKDGVRYIIWINEKGQWYETGEYNKDGKWFQYLEMTLNKVR